VACDRNETNHGEKQTKTLLASTGG